MMVEYATEVGMVAKATTIPAISSFGALKKIPERDRVSEIVGVGDR